MVAIAGVAQRGRPSLLHLPFSLCDVNSRSPPQVVIFIVSLVMTHI